MSKKRVHEIAKELKSHGIDLDNKEVVTALVELGYDVKSHSSSLEDHLAEQAVQKILDKRRPKAAAAPVQAKGFVVRRKVGAPESSQPAAQSVAVPAPAAVAKPENQVAAIKETEPAAVVENTELKNTEPLPAASKPAEVVATVAAQAQPNMPQFAPFGAPPKPAVQPVIQPKSEVTMTGASMRPALSQTVRPSSPPKPSAPSPRSFTNAYTPHSQQSLAQGAAAPQTATQPTRPTATQAVVISRPSGTVRRVTQPSRAFPAAPGRSAVGNDRRFTVVHQQPGRGGAAPAGQTPGGAPGSAENTEISRLSREKEKTRKSRGAERTEQVTAGDIKDMVHNRMVIPVRGKKKRPTKRGQKTLITQMAEEKKVIRIQDGITVSELSQTMGVKLAELIKKLMASGQMVTANQTVDTDTATIIASDYGWRVEKVGFEVEDYLPEGEQTEDDMVSRPPSGTVMGHVDHGKTSLLDAIRTENVAGGEAGGITQHIGAYTVTTSHGDVTFLDTPGHEAFSSMRSRGANLTDIVVLVVAADDGVMPQTKEAIKHAKEAEVPMVVAINKIDTQGANIDRVKKSLADENVLAEDWGGDVIMVPVSAKTKQGLELLLENIALQAEVLELKANFKRPAVGKIVEAKIEKGRGPVATVLVQEGTLRKGDPVVTGTHYGRVRMMVNDRGETIEELLPGYSAELTGLSGVPTAGDEMNVVEDESAAREIAQHRQLKERQADAGKTSKDTLEALLGRMKQGDQKELKVVLKADVQGSLQAVAQALEKLTTPKVKLTIVHKGVGMMTETDVNTAGAVKGIVVGFNSRPESGSEQTAKVLGVSLHTYSIIYELLDGMRTQMEDLLEPIRTEKKLGRAEVRSTFNVPKLGTIAGAAVVDGTIKRSAHLRLWRENQQIFQGKVASLRRFKDDVREVNQGFECGIGIENFSEMKPGDIIEAFEIEETRQSLS